jgi:hypothetical protein
MLVAPVLFQRNGRTEPFAALADMILGNVACALRANMRLCTGLRRYRNAQGSLKRNSRSTASASARIAWRPAAHELAASFTHDALKHHLGIFTHCFGLQKYPLERLGRQPFVE